MQTMVIIVLLLAGVLCIVAQITITYLNSRPAPEPGAAPADPAAIPADEAPTKPARASAARKTSATATSAKTTAAKTAAAKAAAKAEADAEDAAAKAEQEESTRDRMVRHTTAALGSKTAADAKLGMLGLVLLLIAVALVIDITATFAIAT